jgi:hypothetical protein
MNYSKKLNFNFKIIILKVKVELFCCLFNLIVRYDMCGGT